MRKSVVKRNVLLILLLGILAVGLAGCGGQDKVGMPIIMAYISTDGTKIVEEEYYLQSVSTASQVDEILSLLSTTPSKMEYTAPLAQEIEVLDVTVNEDSVILNLSKEYGQLDSITEILTRASVVRSLTQIADITYVAIQVEGSDIRDNDGELVGRMTADNFIDNSGEEISSYEKTTIRLYFANEEGTALKAVNRTLAYNTNIAMERLVLEELIKGPASTNTEVSALLSSDTKVISVIVQDRVCYVNLDETFLNYSTDVDAEVILYGIVNTLCELSNISRVQFSVNGDLNVMFRESISLNTEFTKDLSYVEVD
ncbi:MAG: GerMN domain-containing protein [Lachnospiraceae bacterium]|nr:GerMN domain-containing protein [Lachnospiraceae bacterium]